MWPSQREQVEISADRRGQYTFDSLWPSGGATRVVHPATGCTAQVEWGVARVSRSTVELVADTDHRRLRARARHCEVIGISEYGLHAGIVEDVAHFVRSEVRVHGDEPHAREHRREHELIELDVVPLHRRDMITRLQPEIVDHEVCDRASRRSQSDDQLRCRRASSTAHASGASARFSSNDMGQTLS